MLIKTSTKASKSEERQFLFEGEVTETFRLDKQTCFLERMIAKLERIFSSSYHNFYKKCHKRYHFPYNYFNKVI